MVVLEFLRPAGSVSAEAMIAMRLFRRRAATVEIPPDILSGIKAGILVCTTPRSGSNHLAGLMASAELGRPLEWFGGRRLLELPDYPRAPRAQLLRAVTDGRSSSGIYAIKLFASQFAQVAKKLNLPASLPNPRYVRLTRRDRLGQAISWARARQTRRFRSTEINDTPPRYDGGAIVDSLERILIENLAWDSWFAKNGLPYLSLTYEQIQQDPRASLKQIARLADTELTWGTNIESGLEIQRDTINDEWRERFLSEYADASSFWHRPRHFHGFLKN
ncbi:Stf0 family sulfotransferase [Mesorhizobium abyssinicae]|uniref:Stf0 family sulfotransferase n=1 Tax=Mesorhizobium abyssinicae TaxID=1209958 RepID=A0ABU5AL13_9HYPH|nr:Stf0 family sulfotransferase [Mesorhizobium abyssinicae]MDX8537973.1 Stf0 family sulfotransferase [Mesorhizobium abyssinicae]